MTSPQRDERLRDGLAAVAEWEAEHGALTEEELDAARRRVGVSGPSSGPQDADALAASGMRDVASELATFFDVLFGLEAGVSVRAAFMRHP